LRQYLDTKASMISKGIGVRWEGGVLPLLITLYRVGRLVLPNV
jgi:hypothetical protein